MLKKGFTLLELIVVIIIIGILGTLGFTQYTKVVEKGRTAEAKAILGQMRTSQEAYNMEYGNYATDLNNLFVGAPASCQNTHYFSYSSNNAVGTATRCTTGGKTPNSTNGYDVNITYSTGAWGGSAGYY